MQRWNRFYSLFCAGALALSAVLVVSTAPVYSETPPPEGEAVEAEPIEGEPIETDPVVVDTLAVPTECPRGQGYWRTHSAYGPAPYDATWAEIGEDTEFYNSGQSYHDVLWTPPRGNAYYILAYKAITAELNLLVTDGEASEAYLELYAEASALLEAHGPDTPALIAPGHDNEEGLRAQFIQLAGALEAEIEAAADGNGCPPVEDDANGEDPNGEDPNGEDPNGEDPNGEDPNGEDPNGEDPNGEDPNGEDPNGEDPNGEDPNGETGNGEENNGETGNNENNTENNTGQALEVEGDFSGTVAGPNEPDTLAPMIPHLFMPALSRS